MEELRRLKRSTYDDILVQLNKLQTKLESGVEVESKLYEGIQDNIDLLFKNVIEFFRGNEDCCESSQTMTKTLVGLIQSLANSNSELQKKLTEFKDKRQKLNHRNDANARLMEVKQSTIFIGKLITEIEKKVIKTVLGERHDPDIVTIEHMEKAIGQEAPYDVLSDSVRDRAKQVWKDEPICRKLKDRKLILFMNAARIRRNNAAHPPLDKAGYDRALASEQNPHHKQKYKELWKIYKQL